MKGGGGGGGGGGGAMSVKLLRNIKTITPSSVILNTTANINQNT